MECALTHEQNQVSLEMIACETFIFFFRYQVTNFSNDVNEPYAQIQTRIQTHSSFDNVIGLIIPSRLYKFFYQFFSIPVHPDWSYGEDRRVITHTDKIIFIQYLPGSFVWLSRQRSSIYFDISSYILNGIFPYTFFVNDYISARLSYCIFRLWYDET